MSDTWTRLVSRWTEAGVIDEATAARIRAFEEAHPAESPELRWPIWLALSFGGLMLGAGVLLFVSAHWDTLSPSARFALVLLLVALFHVAAAAMANRSPGMAATLHAVGTVSLGAGIFLTGQIFNLDEHWPSGLMLWAIGAAIAWGLLDEWPQLALVAILGPAWLAGEWSVVSLRYDLTSAAVPAAGAFLLALAYFTVAQTDRADVRRRVLQWVGGLWLLPAALALAFAAALFTSGMAPRPLIAGGLDVVGWTIALGLPLIVAVVLRRAAAWPIAWAVVWVLALVNLHHLAGSIVQYAWWAIGAAALAGWGVTEKRTERINMGSAILAATILTFYFSQVMDKMGRSASLLGLGLLCLAGGWALERGRRHLVRQTREGGPS